MRDARPLGLMLFAAGRGTRMAPLTDRVPKPMIPVAGEALIDRALRLARDGGAGRIVVNIHHLGQQIADHLAGAADIAISDESDALLETGGGLRKALPLLDPGMGPVLTLNPDAVWTGPNPIAALLAHWPEAEARGAEGLVMLVPAGRATAYHGAGDFALDEAGRIARGGPFVYGGAQVIRPNGLAAIEAEAFSLNRLWDAQIARGALHGLVHPGGWCDVGRPDCIPLAEALLGGTAPS